MTVIDFEKLTPEQIQQMEHEEMTEYFTEKYGKDWVDDLRKLDPNDPIVVEWAHRMESGIY